MARSNSLTDNSSQVDARRRATNESGGSIKIVNFGCGPSPALGVYNIDGSLTVLLACLPLPAAIFGSRREFVTVVRKNKIRFGLDRHIKFASCSLDGFYTSHALEHMPRERCEALLARVRSWLKPSGVLRVALPDLKQFASSYTADECDADDFVRQIGLAVDARPWWSIAFGHAQHRWMYDVCSFSRLLCHLGYRDVRQCLYGEGKMPDVALLDLRARRTESFYVEAQP